MTTILSWLATYAVHSTVLLGAVALLTATRVRRDAWRETLWKAALVGGFLTASLQLALSIQPLVGQWELPAHVPAYSRPAAAARLEPRRATAPGPSSAPRATAPIVGTTTRADAASGSVRAGGAPPWPELVVVAWAGIAMFGVGRLFIRRFRLQRLLRERREVGDPAALAMLAQLRRNAGVWRLVRLSATRRASTPFAIGACEICLPERIFEELSLEERRCAIAHELAHLARRDPQWQFLSGLIEAVFFFQPLNRVATVRIREAAEFLSDDWAVSLTGSPIGLARSLAAVSGWVAPDEAVPHAGTAMAEGGSPLLKRVERLLGRRSSAPQPGVVARALAALAMLAATIGAAPGVATREGGRQIVTAPAGTAAVTSVRRPPDPRQSLAERFEWARRDAARRGEDDAWIAYESRSVLTPDRSFGTASWTSSAERPRQQPEGAVFRSARDRSRRPGAPDLVVLLRVSVRAADGFTVVAAGGSSPGLGADLEGRGAYWLAGAGEAESIGLLASLARHTLDARVREKLVEIIAVHRDSAAAVSYLFSVLAGDHVMSVRAAAAEGLAWHPSPAVIERLLRTALGDRSRDVQREAAEALGETGSSAAVAALDQIIDSPAAMIGTRAEAVEALGSFRGSDVLGKFEGIAFGGYDRRIQDAAVEAVADLDLPEMLPLLEHVAFEHPDPEVRSEAMDPLARTGRQADLEALFRIALRDPDPKIQREATEKLADFRVVDAAPFLRRIVWEHESRSVRREALRIIGAMPDAVGLPLLADVVATYPDHRTQALALAAMAAHRTESRERRLREIAHTHPDTVLRGAALDLIGGGNAHGGAGGGRD